MATNSYGWASPQYANKGGGGGGGYTANPLAAMQEAQQRQMAQQQSQFEEAQRAAAGLSTNRMATQAGTDQFQAQTAGGPPYKPPGFLGPLPTGGQPVWNPGAAPQMPGATPFPGMPPMGPNPMMDRWNTGGYNDPSKYGDEGFRNMMEGFTNYGFNPYMNALMAQRTQQMNEQFGGWDRNEQARVNSGQMDLAYRGSAREDEALAFGQKTNQRDFGEAQRQFNAQQGLDAMWKTGQLSAQEYANETARISAQGQIGNDKYANETGRMGVNNQLELGRGALENDRFNNDTTRRNVDQQYDLGLGGLENQRYANQTQRDLGQGQLSNDGRRIDNDFSLGQGRLGLDRDLGQGRLGLDTELGRGQLGVQNRELNVRKQMQRSQLEQEADLTREKFQNDLTQSRYQAFGRAQAPNAKAVRSWY
jgi:hypothetical protein